MPREATLFEQSGGSPIRAYLLMKANGSANVPPNWIKRARTSRKNRHTEMARILRKGKVQDYFTLEDWDLAYRKECFYQGIRILLDLERDGKTSL